MLKKVKEALWDVAAFLAGGLLYSISVNVFTLPAAIAPAGWAGIGAILHYLFGFPVGLTVLVLNLPLFVLGARTFGKSFLPKTVAATVLSSVLIDLTAPLLPSYQGNPLLSALYGGVLSGFGLTLVFLRGGTTGGTDIAAKLLVRKARLPLGRMILLLDAVIILLSMVVYRNVDSGLYACLLIFTATTIVDRFLTSGSGGKMVWIISRSPAQINQGILRELQRGCTLLYAKGGFSMAPRQVLLCVVRPNQLRRVKQLVRDADPTAFMMVTDAVQVLGEGFVQLSRE